MTQNILTQLLAKYQYSLFVVVLAAALGVRLGSGALAATFSVNNTVDAVDATPGDGVCAVAGGHCTLRAAIQEANALAGADTINIPAGIYTLTFASELTIDEDLTLTGAGAGSSIIQAAPRPGVAGFRVFNITSDNVTISGVTIRHGNSSSGGGIYNEGTLALASSAVSGNTSGHFGGGISNYGKLTLANSTVSGNTSASGAGGIANGDGTLTLINSTVSGNTAGNLGGGIYSNYGTLTLTDSTISGNTAIQEGGGISNWYGTLTLTNCTISANVTSSEGGGLYIGFGPVDLVNTIIAGNKAVTSGPDCAGNPISSLGHNLIGSNSGCAFTPAKGDLVGTGTTPIDPLLGPLKDNGGPTETHALLEGSPAIDAGDDSAAPVTDQRGVARPQGSVSDIGAYEFESGPTAPIARDDTYVVTENTSLTVDTAHGVLSNDSDQDEDLLRAVLVSDVSYGMLTLNPDGSFIYTPDSDFHGTDSFTYKATDGLLNSNVGTVTITISGTLTVTKTEDTNDGVCDSDCSLREAIGAAGPGDTIDIPSGIYTLTLGFQLSITKDLTLIGAGVKNTIIQAATATSPGMADFRVFHIPGSNVTISGVTIRYGNTHPNEGGGGIYNEGTLTLTNSAVSGNTASFGGGIHNNYGTLVLINSTIDNNGVSSSGGGIFNSGGTVTLTDSAVSGNRASGSLGGGGILSSSGTLTLTNSTVNSNTAGSEGGGIYIYLGMLTLTNSTVSGNTANFNGGGIVNWGGTITLIGSTISSNTASQEGGGIYSYLGTTTLTNSTISSNTARYGGGGIFNSNGPLTLTSSTVSKNAGNFKNGGGIFNQGPLKMTNSTISGNTTMYEGGGIYSSGGRVMLVNTIIAGNTAGRGGPDCSGNPLTSLGYNLIGNNSGCSFTHTTGDLVNVDPKLGPLQDNGGPTFTHELFAGSPAIDAGDDSKAPSADQRGIARPQGTACDIGAYEFVPPLPDIKANGSDEQINIIPRDPLGITITLDPGDREGEKADWWLAIDTPFGLYWYNGTAWTPSASVAYQGPLVDIDSFEILNITGLPVGTYTIYFGFDLREDGVLNEPLYYDSVTVKVS